MTRIIKDTNEYSTEAEETHKRHMLHTRQGVISTEENIQVLKPSADRTTINVPPLKHCNIYVKVTETKNTIYTDQAGKFPVTSRRGHKCLMIMC